MGVQGCRKKKKGKGKEEADEDKGVEMKVTQLTGDAKAMKLLKSSEGVKNLCLFARFGAAIGTCAR